MLQAFQLSQPAGIYVGSEHTYDFVVLANSSNDVSHYMRQEKNTRNVDDEGMTNVNTERSCGVCMVNPFSMPYHTMLPQRSEVTNLLVPVAISATHVR